MTKKISIKKSALHFIVIITVCNLATAQNFVPPRATTGDVEISSSSDSERPDHLITQDKIIEYFKNASQTVSAIKNSSGAVAELPILTETELTFLNAVYLYCTIHEGSCRSVLDALLEVDLINSHIKSSAKCPSLVRFWKLWIRNSFEDRLKYQVKTTFLKTTSDFSAKIRPKYIRCQKTVQDELTLTKNLVGLSKKYNEDPERANLFPAIVLLLEKLKGEVQNIFIATGSRKS